MKLMTMIAAVLAVGGVLADCSYNSNPTAWVYKWKFTGKTTYGTKPQRVKTVQSLCGYNGGGSESACVVRTPSSLKIEGYTWMCEPGCGSDGFEMFPEVNEIFWQKKPFKASLAGGVAAEVSNIIGKNAKQFETAGTATFTEFINEGTIQEGTYTFTYAGLGKYDQKNGRVKSASGNFAGFLNQPHYITKEFCGNAGFWECGTPLTLECEGKSVAYGKWSVKYQKSASKKFLSYGRLPKVPSWAKHMNQEN